jgi:hypothetical protein
MGKLIVTGAYVQPGVTGVGFSAARYTKMMQIRSTPEMVYRLRKLRVNVAFKATGAGYAYRAEWKVLRRETAIDPLNMFIVQSNTNYAKSGERNILAGKGFEDGDSYAYAGSSPGMAFGEFAVDWDVDIAPLFIQELYLAAGLHVVYDGTPSRSWVLDVMATIYWEPVKLSRKAWNELAEELASLSLR